MDAANTSVLDTELGSSFGRQHFGHCDFGDKRLTDRAICTADAFVRHPGGTLPAKLDKAELRGFYGFANNVKVNHDNTLHAHRQRTLELMRQCKGTVLVLHDTTECDNSGLDIPDLGPIGNGHNRGMLVHNSLAVDYARHEVLGLAGQVIQTRRNVKKNEGVRASRRHPQRESRLWVKGIEAVGHPPEGAMWVNVSDRGGDTFESMDRQQDLGQLYLTRSRTNRSVHVKDSAGRTQVRKLHDWARRLSTLGERRVAVQENHGQAKRDTTVSIAAGPVQIQVPKVKYGEHGREPLAAWVIHVKEIRAPKGQEPLEWILLTNCPTETKEQAFERVDWYQCRPIIEEFHKAQKTGCGMELQQFTTRKALEVTIAMLSVIAVQLLRLRDMARNGDQRPAREVVDEKYIEAISLKRYKEVRPDLTAREFLLAVARLGGHLNRTHDGLPGWLTLWRGWMELQRLVEGMQLAKLKRSR